MSAPGESSDVTGTGSTTTSLTSLVRRRPLDPEALSPTSKAIRILIGDEKVDGYKINEIAIALGRPTSWVSEQEKWLRSEIDLQTTGFLDLSDEDFEALKESIAENGILVPILIGEHGIIDGRHRARAWLDLGFPPENIPFEVVPGLTAEQEHEKAVMVNVIRRHLNREQKQFLVGQEIRRDAARSDRMIAQICGVSPTTVGSIRQQVERETGLATRQPTAAEVSYMRERRVEDSVAQSQPSKLDSSAETPGDNIRKRLGRDGKSRIVTPKPPPPEPAQLIRDLPEMSELLGYVTCPHGQVLRLHKHNWEGRYVLVEEEEWPSENPST